MRACGITIFYNPTVEIVHHYRSTLSASLRQQFAYGLGLHDFVRKAPDHFALLPSTPRGAWRFASNMVMRPLKKALQAESTAQLAAYLPVLFLLNAAYTAGVVFGMSRGQPSAGSEATLAPTGSEPA
jgi:hypothetical protein